MVHRLPARDAQPEPSRARILTAALELFADRGFAGTSVRALAERAGVSQGLLYNYFDGKDGLLRAIFEQSQLDVTATLDEANDHPEESVPTLIRAAFAAVQGNAVFWRLTYQLRMQGHTITLLGGVFREWADSVRARIEALLRADGVPDPAVRARVLFAAIDGAAQHWVLDPDGYPLDQVADALAELATAHPAGRNKRSP